MDGWICSKSSGNVPDLEKDLPIFIKLILWNQETYVDHLALLDITTVLSALLTLLKKKTPLQ